MSKSFKSSGVPSPSPSNASASTNQKRKRVGETKTAVQLQHERKPQGSHELVTIMTQAEDRLQSQNKEQTFEEIVNFLSIQHGDPQQLHLFKALMQRNGAKDKIAYNSRGANGKGTYKYKSIYPVHNEDDLRALLQKRTHAIGIKVDDLKDGWQDKVCIPALDTMQGNGELLLVRDKNGRPKTVWQDDKTLHAAKAIDADLQDKWHSIKIPVDTEEMRNKLIAAGLNPTSAARKVVAKQSSTKKRKGPRRGGRQTNIHMAGVLKDYSGGRP